MEVHDIVREYLSKVKRVYESGGVPLLLMRIFRKTCYAVFRTNNAIWFCRDLSYPIVEIRPQIPVEVDWNSSRTLEWLRTEWPRTRTATGAVPMLSNAEEREIYVGIKGNHYFPSARYQGDIIGYVKVGHGEVYIMDFDMNIYFPKGTVFIYDTYTSTDFRGLGIAPFLITDVMRFLKQRGYERILCHIPTWNLASIRAYTKCSFEKIKRIWYFRIFGKKWFSTHPETL